ncbi:MAG: FemAB family PEP-CTERM system-associated protein [Acidobacteria bacterium]|nr:FemAB family PEP-CTERM system-associated protein [Acidobacteriota bacterium]
MGLRVGECNDHAAWDVFVRSLPAASHYHIWKWKNVIEETYGHASQYLAASQEGTIQGVLPLFLVKSRLFGRFLVSLPFLNYGGVLASSTDVQQALLVKASEVAHELGARYVELRQGSAGNLGWQDVAFKVAMVVPLPKTVDELWRKLSSRLRNKIRSAMKHGLTVRWGGSEAVSAFYRVFAPNMRNLGTPVYPRQWFENVCRITAHDSRVLTLWKEDRPIAATLITTFRDGVELPWIASLPEERKLHSTVLLYWTALEWAVQNGYRRVDLGRCTPGGGTYQFKRQWDCEERPLHWYYWLAPGVPLPQLRPENPRFRAAVWAWKRLPLGVANWLGPRIVRSIP